MRRSSGGSVTRAGMVTDTKSGETTERLRSVEDLFQIDDERLGDARRQPGKRVGCDDVIPSWSHHHDLPRIGRDDPVFRNARFVDVHRPFHSKVATARAGRKNLDDKSWFGRGLPVL